MFWRIADAAFKTDTGILHPPLFNILEFMIFYSFSKKTFKYWGTLISFPLLLFFFTAVIPSQIIGCIHSILLLYFYYSCLNATNLQPLQPDFVTLNLFIWMCH